MTTPAGHESLFGRLSSLREAAHSVVRRPEAPIRLRSRLPLVVGLVALVMYIFDPYDAWRMLLILMAALLGMGYLWTQTLLQGIRFTRSRRYGWAQVGDRVEEQFELTNSSILPLLWVELEDESTLPGYTARRVEAIPSQSVKRWTLDMVCARRGVYQIGPLRLRLGDPFGLFEAVYAVPGSETFVVYPPVSRLPRLELPRGAAPGTARVRRRALEWTTNAAGARKYVPGDQLRLIHWPLTAKQGSLYVREFDLEPSGDVWVVLDLDAQVHAGSGFESTEEYGVIFAASLINAMLAEGRAVGLAASGSVPALIQPSRGAEHFWRVLRALALVALAPGPALSDFLTGAAPSLGRGLTLVLITPATHATWLGTLAGLQRQGLAAHVVLLDPASFDPAARQADILALAGRLAEIGVTLTRVQRGYHFEPIARGRRQGVQEYVVGATGRIIARPVEE